MKRDSLIIFALKWYENIAFEYPELKVWVGFGLSGLLHSKQFVKSYPWGQYSRILDLKKQYKYTRQNCENYTENWEMFALHTPSSPPVPRSTGGKLNWLPGCTRNWPPPKVLLLLSMPAASLSQYYAIDMIRVRNPGCNLFDAVLNISQAIKTRRTTMHRSV